jgi:hypothetical protein
MKPHVEPTNNGCDNVPINPPYGVIHWPTMPLPLPTPTPLQPMYPIAFVSSHVHFVQFPKNYKELAIEPQISKEKWSAISVNSDSLETYAYTIKSLPPKLEDDAHNITFDGMHL